MNLKRLSEKISRLQDEIVEFETFLNESLKKVKENRKKNGKENTDKVTSFLEIERAISNRKEILDGLITKYNHEIRRLNSEEFRRELRKEKQEKKIVSSLRKELSEYKVLLEGMSVINFSNKKMSETEFDVFISHATEDKELFVRPLAEILIKHEVKVWYDELQLKIGDSLRREINKGLSKSRFGIVILSPSFFAKQWTQYELDGLITKEMKGEKVILPIWHKVSKDEVMSFSLPLADKVALSTSILSIEEIASKIAEVLRQ